MNEQEYCIYQVRNGKGSFNYRYTDSPARAFAFASEMACADVPANSPFLTQNMSAGFGDSFFCYQDAYSRIETFVCIQPRSERVIPETETSLHRHGQLRAVLTYRWGSTLTQIPDGGRPLELDEIVVIHCDIFQFDILQFSVDEFEPGDWGSDDDSAEAQRVGHALRDHALAWFGFKENPGAFDAELTDFHSEDDEVFIDYMVDNYGDKALDNVQDWVPLLTVEQAWEDSRSYEVVANAQDVQEIDASE